MVYVAVYRESWFLEIRGEFYRIITRITENTDKQNNIALGNGVTGNINLKAISFVFFHETWWVEK